VARTGEVSSWRAPWFETHMVEKPARIARFASSGRTTPLIATGPPHSLQSHSASSQLKAGLICELTKAASESAGTSLLMLA
jgi:hypothetical protein